MSRRREPLSPYNPLEQFRSRPGPSPVNTTGSAAAVPNPEPAAAVVPGSLRPGRPARRLPCLRVGMHADRKRAFEQLCHRLGGSLDASLPPSQVLRVCCEMLLAHQDVLLGEAHGLGPLTRPPNDDQAAMRRFESTLMGLLLRGLRLPLRPADRP